MSEESKVEAALYQEHFAEEEEEKEDDQEEKESEANDEEEVEEMIDNNWKKTKPRCRTLSTVDSSVLELTDGDAETVKLDPLPPEDDDEMMTRRSLCCFSQRSLNYMCHPFKNPRTLIGLRPSGPSRWIRKFLVYSILLFAILLLILWSGKLYEEAQVRKGQDTLRFYQTPKVCAMIVTNDKAAAEEMIETQTFDSVDQLFTSNQTTSSNANTTRTVIAHCGECGSCSNPNDIRVYDETKNTLYKDSVECARHGILKGKSAESAVQQCLSERVDFTTPCNKCWADNIMCDLQKCIFTCLFHAVFNKGVHPEEESEPLNDCTKCDEIRCGAQFITCAGANRRRTGILSDIERNVDMEVCQKVQPPNWWNDESIQLAWNVQQNAIEAQEATSP